MPGITLEERLSCALLVRAMKDSSECSSVRVPTPRPELRVARVRFSLPGGIVLTESLTY